MSQTTIQDNEALRWGSAKIEAALYADGFGSLQNLGAIRDLVITETWESVKIDSDNAGTVSQRIKNQMLNIKFTWLEAQMTKLYMLRGQSIDTYATVAASPDTVTDEEVVLNDTDVTRLAYKNADDTICTSIVVTTNATTPVTLTKDTDYGVGVDADGWTCITRIAGGAIGDDDTVLVDYGYTPASQKTLSTGGGVEIASIVLRFTNTDEDSTDLRVDVYEAYVKTGLNLTFMSDQADDVNGCPMEFEAVLDESRTAKDQLMKIYDAQSVA